MKSTKDRRTLHEDSMQPDGVDAEVKGTPGKRSRVSARYDGVSAAERRGKEAPKEVPMGGQENKDEPELGDRPAVDREADHEVDATKNGFDTEGPSPDASGFVGATASVTEREAKEQVQPTSSIKETAGSATASHQSSLASGHTEKVAHSTVAPGGTPTSGTGSNDCLPSTANAALSWVVVEDGPNWRVEVQSLTLAGQVNVKPWPSNPTNDRVTPNTPNPDEGGNINNKRGSSNRWSKALSDLRTYNQVGGGRGPDWHDTAASRAHEWAHWNIDYVQDSVSSAAGGNWPSINGQLDALSVTKASHPTAAGARTALTSQVNALMRTWRQGTIKRWNAIPDSPGVAGATGYAAGAAVLLKHIDTIEAYRIAKGWN